MIGGIDERIGVTKLAHIMLAGWSDAGRSHCATSKAGGMTRVEKAPVVRRFDRGYVALLVSAFLVTAGFRFLGLRNGFVNDHFMHLSGAQQMLFGEWPTRYFRQGSGFPGRYIDFLILLIGAARSPGTRRTP